MKKTFTYMRGAMLTLAMLVLQVPSTLAQDKPQVKVDVSITNRNNPDETQEPGYEWWRVEQGKQSDTFEAAGLKFTFVAPTGQKPDYIVRSGWSKTFIQNADNKTQNGRLTYDGVTLDPNDNSYGAYSFYGQLTLRIEGLPAGSHTLLTYHNCWENPANWYAAPMTVSCNGQEVQAGVVPTFGQAVAANTTIVTIPFNVANDGDVVEVTFATSADQPGQPTNGQANEFRTPLLNGFKLNTVNVATQAKEPQPANGDMHTDADGGSITLSWGAASADIKEHRLYFGTAEDALELLATLSETSYTVDNLYSMNTYYWRVDEVDQNGQVSEGQTWSFKPRQLAFPGAEGYGRFAQGGRGGSVYHVTSQSNENVPGTLKYGLTSISEPHTIVFDVSGLIEMDFGSLFTTRNITIAGQTAPGKGICIKASNINIGSDNICRFIRFKRGLGVYGENTGNAMGMSGADHAIVDHCTAAWGTDETISGRGAKNISFQYSVISEALGIAGHKNYADGTNHGYAATIDGKIGSWHHNLLVNCNGRNWSMGGGMDGENRAIGQMDIFNNVVYNWNGRTTDGNCHEVNFVGNYYKMGPDTRHTILFTQNYENVGHPESTWRAYINGNIRENKNHTLTQDAKNVTYNVVLSNGDPGPKYETVVNEPFFPSYAAIHSAKDALKIVASTAGATMPMPDEHHLRNIRETIDGTYTYVGSKSKIKGEIDSEADITEHENGWEAWPEETRPADWDTDQDGMPNWYERLTGSNPQVADHNDDPDHDGWTRLEDYLEFMAHPYIVLEPGTMGTVNVAPYFRGFFGFNGKKSTPEFSISSESPLFSAAIADSIITVNAGNGGGIGIVTMKVKDSEGTEFEQRLSVAVTGDPTAIQPIWSEEGINVVRREFFTLDGKKVNHMQSHEVYLMKVTDSEGCVHAVKIIKN